MAGCKHRTGTGEILFYLGKKAGKEGRAGRAFPRHNNPLWWKAVRRSMAPHAAHELYIHDVVWPLEAPAQQYKNLSEDEDDEDDGVGTNNAQSVGTLCPT